MSLDGLHQLHQTWNTLAERDPYWAVLSKAENRLGAWDPEAFFTSGRAEVQRALLLLTSRGFAVDADGTALDFGCGLGRLTRPLGGYFRWAVGVDISERMVELAQELTPEINVRYLVNRRADLGQLADGSFALVYSGRVLQHIPPELSRVYLTEFVRLLAPGGFALFTLPAGVRGADPAAARLPPGAYAAELQVSSPPRVLTPGASADLAVSIHHRGDTPWPGVVDLGACQIRLGNHWLDAAGRLVVEDDGRTPLTTPVPAGGTREVRLRIEAPAVPGEYLCELDLVQEHVTWFAAVGSPTCRFALTVAGVAGTAAPPPTPEAATTPPAEAATAHHAIEMFGVPRAEVEQLLRAAGGELIAAQPDGSAGPEWENYLYLVRRPPPRPSFWQRLRGTTRRAAGLLVASVALLAAGCQGTAPAAPGSDPRCPGCNVVLISIDTLRANRLSAYGYERPTSPNLEAFAREAVLFERFYYNGGGTLPSHMSMFTSLYPGTHGLHPSKNKSLEPQRVTLAERLQSSGYATAGFADNGWMRAQFGFDQGFDLYDDAGHHFAQILPRAKSWLDQHLAQVPAGAAGPRPFFLFLHTYDVHSQGEGMPYGCPGDFPARYVAGPPAGYNGCRGPSCASQRLAEINSAIRAGHARGTELISPAERDYLSAVYDGCINYVDHRLAEVFQWLRTAGLWDQTVIAVTSDHGEEFLEHGYLIHDQGGFEELAHIPLVVKLPRSQAGGTRVPFLAEMVDVAPTLLDLVALASPAEAQGSSLLPSVFENRPVTTEVHMYGTLLTSRYKYFRDEKLLFDLQRDPLERLNLFFTQRFRATLMERQIRGLIRADFRARDEFAARASAGAPAELSAEDRARLRALGYLQ